MESKKIYINIIKVKYTFDDGKEMKGVELHLAPKVKKFVQMNKDNCELLKMMGNGLLDWYNNAEFGDDIFVENTFEIGGYSVPVRVE